MSRAATLSRRSPKAKASGKGYLPDRVAGGVAMALDALAIAMAARIVDGIHAAGLSLAHGRTLDYAVLALNLVGHIGVFRGARWGFALAGALAAWGLLSLGLTRGFPVVLSTNLWMLLYAAFRLGSVYGPKAR